MNRNFERALAEVLKHEGGFVNHPSDPGGATNKGITIGTYRRYVDRNGTVADLKRITDDQVAKVYRKQYWDKVRGDDLPDGVDFAVFDFAVNSGPARASRYLQSVVGAVQDGKIGPATVAATGARLPSDTINRLCDDRLAFLRNLSTWRTFGRGWTNRIARVRSVALDMAGKRSSPISAQEPQEAEEPELAPNTPEATENASAANSDGFLAVLIAALARLFKRKD